MASARRVRLPDWEPPLVTSPASEHLTGEGLPDWGDLPYRPVSDAPQLQTKSFRSPAPAQLITKGLPDWGEHPFIPNPDQPQIQTKRQVDVAAPNSECTSSSDDELIVGKLPDWKKPVLRKEPVQVQVQGNKLLTVEPPTSRVWVILPEEKRQIKLTKKCLEKTVPKKRVLIEMPAHRYYVDVPRMHLELEVPDEVIADVLSEEGLTVIIPRRRLQATMIQKCPFEDDVLRPDFEYRARQHFRALDKDKKGYLSLKDVWYGLEEETGKNFTREEIEEIFGYIDHNKSGRISEDEWLQAVKILQ